MKKIILPLLLAIIFSCGQAFAAKNTAVYDKDEKNFITAFNEIASTEKIFTFEATPQLMLNDGECDIYAAKSIPDTARTALLFRKNKNGAIESIGISSSTNENLDEAVTITLMVLGLNDDEFKSLTTNRKDNSTSVWCSAAKRNITVEKAVEGKTFTCLIEASVN